MFPRRMFASGMFAPDYFPDGVGSQGRELRATADVQIILSSTLDSINILSATADGQGILNATMDIDQ